MQINAFLCCYGILVIKNSNLFFVENYYYYDYYKNYNLSFLLCFYKQPNIQNYNFYLI